MSSAGEIHRAAWHFGNVLDFEGWVARVDAFRGERQEEVLADFGSLRLEQRQEQLLGGPGVGGGLQNYQLARAEARGGLLGGGDHVGDVRVLGLPERRGDANQDDVAFRQNSWLGRGLVASRAQERLKRLARNVGDVGVTAGEGRTRWVGAIRDWPERESRARPWSQWPRPPRLPPR